MVTVVGESFPRRKGVTFALGVNDRGVTHSGESFTPLTTLHRECNRTRRVNLLRR